MTEAVTKLVELSPLLVVMGWFIWQLETRFTRFVDRQLASGETRDKAILKILNLLTRRIEALTIAVTIHDTRFNETEIKTILERLEECQDGEDNDNAHE